MRVKRKILESILSVRTVAGIETEFGSVDSNLGLSLHEVPCLRRSAVAIIAVRVMSLVSSGTRQNHGKQDVAYIWTGVPFANTAARTSRHLVGWPLG